ncbi:MAG: hypothetical protein ACXAB7_00065 [Candidatus Kariarchaeaceae archaeon]|jgi:hypothetical protein
MENSRPSSLQRLLRQHKSEVYITLFVLAITISFIGYAWIKGDFNVLDHSYWIGIIAYNIVLAYGIWLTFSKRSLQLSEGILYIGLFFTFLLGFFFRDIIFTGDITQGVIKGAEMFWEGKNPYTVAEVPHAQPYPLPPRYVTYAYLPVDLLSYAVLLGILNFISSIFTPSEVPWFLPGFNELGILIINLTLMIVSVYILKTIYELTTKQAALLGSFIFLVLIWNNVCLALTFFIVGLYFHKKNQSTLVIVFWSLSMLSKYFAGIFIVSYLIEYLRKQEYFQVFTKAAITTIISILVSIPFGIMDVLKSTVLFYNTEERILDGSFGGSIVSELVLFFQLEDIVWVFTLTGFLIILIIGLLLHDLLQRLVVMSCLALFVITGISAQFLPMILLILMLAGKILIFEPQQILPVSSEIQQSGT